MSLLSGPRFKDSMQVQKSKKKKNLQKEEWNERKKKYERGWAVMSIQFNQNSIAFFFLNKKQQTIRLKTFLIGQF